MVGQNAANKRVNKELAFKVVNWGEGVVKIDFLASMNSMKLT